MVETSGAGLREVGRGEMMRGIVGMVLLGCVAGHGMLSIPAPRAGTQQAGPNKGNVGPCGTATATAAAPSAELQAGTATTVTWTLAAAHAGPCNIRIAQTDAALADAPLLETVAACNQQNSVAVTVPAGLSGNAVLQWHWQGDGPYFDCADVTVTGRGAANSAAGGGALSSELEDPIPYAEVEVVFSNDMADVEAAGGAWEAGVVTAIATHVGIPASRIEIAKILPGSIRVFIRFLEALVDGDEQALSADDSAKLFSEQLDAGTDVMTDPSFACCYESHEITQWSSPTWMYLKWFVAFLVVASCILGTLKFLQWKKESAVVKAELELREKEQDAVADAGYAPKATRGDSDGADTLADALSFDNEAPTLATGSAQPRPARLKPPSLAGIESRFFAAAPPTEVDGGGGGWGTMRTASRQIQTARALGAMRASRRVNFLSLPPSLSLCLQHT